MVTVLSVEENAMTALIVRKNVATALSEEGIVVTVLSVNVHAVNALSANVNEVTALIVRENVLSALSECVRGSVVTERSGNANAGNVPNVSVLNVVSAQNAQNASKQNVLSANVASRLIVSVGSVNVIELTEMNVCGTGNVMNACEATTENESGAVDDDKVDRPDARAAEDAALLHVRSGSEKCERLVAVEADKCVTRHAAVNAMPATSVSRPMPKTRRGAMIAK